MKSKNKGFSTVEIVVAAVILVAVVVGLLLVVKLSKNSDTTSEDETKATQIVDALLSQVDADVRSADLDVNYDADNYIRFIGRNKCQFFLFDSASGNVYVVEKNSSEFGSDDETIRTTASEQKPAKEEMSVTATNVKTFIIELVGADTAEGSVKTTVRAQIGNDITGNVSKSQNTPLNGEVIKYYADRAGHDVEVPSATPTPIPTNTATPTPTQAAQPTSAGDTPTPEPTTAADTPTPTPGEKELQVKHKFENPQTNAETIVINTIVPPIYPEDAVLIILVQRGEDETENLTGATIGGIGLDVGVPADGYTFVLDHDPEPGEVLRFGPYPLKDFIEFKNVSGIQKLVVKVNDNSGYSLIGADIEYYK
ncbi:MAG: hypothetical protein J5531_09685 [Lachnospiraceae bacterium]|nr:hypothetical protein [Lachnospiraceae bacterium]